MGQVLVRRLFIESKDNEQVGPEGSPKVTMGSEPNSLSFPLVPEEDGGDAGDSGDGCAGGKGNDWSGAGDTGSLDC